MSQRNLGDLLVESGIISPAELEEALRRQRLTGRRLGVELREMGLCTSEDVEWALSAQFKLPFVRLTPGHVDPEAARSIPEELARSALLVPTWVVGNTLHVVLADPTRTEAIERVRELARRKVQISLGLPSEIRRAIDEAYPESQGRVRGQLGLYDSPLLNPDEEVEINHDATGRRFVEALLRKATLAGASGVLFEVSGTEARVRMRTPDGWKDAAHCHPDWLASSLDRLEAMASSRDDGPIGHGKLEISGEADRGPLTFSVKCWRGLDQRSAVVQPLARWSEGGALVADRLPAAILEADGIVIVDAGKRGAAIGFAAIAARAVDHPGGVAAAVGLAGSRPPGNTLVEIPGDDGLSGTWPEARGLPFEIVILPNPADEDPVPFFADARLRGHRLATNLAGRSAPEVARRVAASHLAAAAGDLRIVEAVEVPLLCSDCRKPAPGADAIRRLAAIPGDGVLHSSAGCPRCLHTGFRGILRLVASASLGEATERGPLADRLDEMLASGEIAVADYLEATGGSTAMTTTRRGGNR